MQILDKLHDQLRRLFTGRPAGVSQPAIAKAPKPAPKVAVPKGPTYQGKPATGQFVDAPRPRDPWCRDDRRPAPGEEPWVPERHWF